ncbi:MAG: tRNA uridine-5-carboxymethylaminomethyl(34) synthesis GTPase MnmE [Armatimonadota bacterium]|nr:tRNA uridine-5-carboxymethylaminomethyl(34) synthesis GTPase MnmE [Armatimonadota bacterium]
MHPDDTIAAIATARGEAAIGVIRVSGPAVGSLIERLFHTPRGAPLPRRATLGAIRDPHTGELVDQVVLTFYPAPASYTGEDVAEISAHGGTVPLRRILGLTLAYGARLAQPGEFTLRAFLNGKLDLAQAEAVIDIIQARTDRGLSLAANQLAGRLSAAVYAARDAVLPLLAHIEATIDFPEDVPEMPPETVAAEIRRALHAVEELLAGAHRGRIYRDGVRVVIAGRPNVGKSSLLNALLREERAIVTEVPGTTRDVIEESANVAGIPLRAIDTAGIRAPGDPVEAIGVQRSLQQLDAADLVLLVVDASQPLTEADQDIAARVGNRAVVVAANKQDRRPKPAGHAISPLAEPDLEALRRHLPGAPVVPVSALRGEGIDALERAIAEVLLGNEVAAGDDPLVTSARHAAALEAAAAGLRRALDTLEEELPLEFLATDLQDALHSLALVTGESVTDEVLSHIFGRFCIGK